MRTVLVVSFLALASSCGSNECSPRTCSTCCSETGECVLSVSEVACGAGGFACDQCDATQVCGATGCLAGVSPLDAGVSSSSTCAGIGPARGLSERCCTAFGVDACGAGLFCAAFDGRTVTTCYPERSRADSTSCTENRQCLSDECNLTRGLCKATPGLSCTLDIGCARSPTGERRVCTGTCVATSGRLNNPCERDSDCDQAVCTSGVCRCGADSLACDGACTPRYSQDSCGRCGAACNSTERCAVSRLGGELAVCEYQAPSFSTCNATCGNDWQCQAAFNGTQSVSCTQPSTHCTCARLP